jgi:hypothetical protein
MYDMRVNQINNTVNLLLIIISFLPIISLTLMNYFKETIFLIPIIFQLLAFFVIITIFFVESPKVHWFRIVDNDILKEIDKEKFDINLLADLKSIENMTWVYLDDFAKKIIRTSIYLILFSLYLIGLAFIFIFYINNNWEYILTSIVTSIFFTGLLIIKNIKLKYNYNSDFNKFKKQIEEWLNEK